MLTKFHLVILSARHSFEETTHELDPSESSVQAARFVQSVVNGESGSGVGVAVGVAVGVGVGPPGVAVGVKVGVEVGVAVGVGVGAPGSPNSNP